MDAAYGEIVRGTALFLRGRSDELVDQLKERMTCAAEQEDYERAARFRDQIARLKKRLAARKISLELDEDARKWLADEGYDPVFGARPLKRVIQRALQNPLAELLLGGEVKDGDILPITAGADGLIIGDRLGTSDRTAPDDAVIH